MRQWRSQHREAASRPLLNRMCQDNLLRSLVPLQYMLTCQVHACTRAREHLKRLIKLSSHEAAGDSQSTRPLAPKSPLGSRCVSRLVTSVSDPHAAFCRQVLRSLRRYRQHRKRREAALFILIG